MTLKLAVYNFLHNKLYVALLSKNVSNGIFITQLQKHLEIFTDRISKTLKISQAP